MAITIKKTTWNSTTDWGKGHNEIDIVAINEKDKVAVFAEIKMNKSKLEEASLIKKSVALLPALKGYLITYELLS